MTAANFVQAGFAFYEDGTESGATIIGSIDTDISRTTGNVFQIRIEVTNDGGMVANCLGTLFYSHQGGTYTRVSATSNVVQAAAGAVTDGEVTTERLAGPNTFVAGFVDESNGQTANVAIENAPQEDTEFLFSITIVGADVSNGQTIDLRVYDGTTALGTYNITPRITVSAGATENDRSGDDGILLKSEDEREHDKLLADQVLLDDSGVSLLERIKTAADALVLLDLRFGTLEKIAPNPLLLFDVPDFIKFLSQVVADNLLLLQDGSATHRRAITGDTVLLGDAVQAVFTQTRSALDSLLIRDERTSVIEREIANNILLLDTLVKTVERFKLDSLLLDDAQTVNAIRAGIERTVADGLFLLSQDIRAQEHTFADSILFNDEALKEILLTLADNILLDETQAAIKLRAAVQRAVADQILLLDQRVSAKEITLADSVLLKTEIVKEILLRLADGLLLDDTVTVATAGLQLRAVADQLLLADQSVRETILTLQDKLLLGDAVTVVSEAAQIFSRQVDDDLLLLDQRRSILEFQQLSTLLLSDDVTVEKLGVQIRSVADALMLADQRTSIREMTVLNNALLGDAAIKLRELLTADDVLLFDTVGAAITRQILQADQLLLSDATDLLSALTRSVQDDVMLSDLTVKLRELTQDDQLLLFDSVTRTIFEAFIQALVWAQLRARDLLGVRLNYETDILGVENKNQANYLRTSAGYVRTTDLRLITV
jgi:hypothetical protein